MHHRAVVALFLHATAHSPTMKCCLGDLVVVVVVGLLVVVVVVGLLVVVVVVGLLIVVVVVGHRPAGHLVQSSAAAH